MFVKKCYCSFDYSNFLFYIFKYFMSHTSIYPGDNEVIWGLLTTTSVLSAIIVDTKTVYAEAAPKRCSMWKGVFRNFTKFTGKHLCQTLSFNKLAGLRPATSSKKILWHRCFPVNFAKFLRTFFAEHLWTTASVHVKEFMVSNKIFLCWSVIEWRNL